MLVDDPIFEFLLYGKTPFHFVGFFLYSALKFFVVFPLLGYGYELEDYILEGLPVDYYNFYVKYFYIPYKNNGYPIPDGLYPYSEHEVVNDYFSKINTKSAVVPARPHMVSLPSNLPLSYYDYIFSEFGDDDKMYKCGYFVTTRSKFPLKLSTPQIFFPRSWNNYAYVCNDAYYMFWKNFEINKFYRTNILDYCVGTGILFSDFGYSGNFEYYTSSNNFVSTPVVFTRSDNYNSFNISYLYKVSLPKYPYFYDNHTFLFEILFFSFILIFFYLYISYIFICLYILKCLFLYIDEKIFEFDENDDDDNSDISKDKNIKNNLINKKSKSYYVMDSWSINGSFFKIYKSLCNLVFFFIMFMNGIVTFYVIFYTSFIDDCYDFILSLPSNFHKFVNRLTRFYYYNIDLKFLAIVDVPEIAQHPELELDCLPEEAVFPFYSREGIQVFFCVVPVFFFFYYMFKYYQEKNRVFRDGMYKRKYSSLLKSFISFLSSYVFICRYLTSIYRDPSCWMELFPHYPRIIKDFGEPKGPIFILFLFFLMYCCFYVYNNIDHGTTDNLEERDNLGLDEEYPRHLYQKGYLFFVEEKPDFDGLVWHGFIINKFFKGFILYGFVIFIFFPCYLLYDNVLNSLSSFFAYIYNRFFSYKRYVFSRKEMKSQIEKEWLDSKKSKIKGKGKKKKFKIL